ncbi:unnamed protein product [Adineta ricciae]|uniref:GH26 domain-containing protein n=1 Tax=Adineta ricciae TaxID=249248 RepID=A0A813YCV5_ADIRI|nr:unnamed protein product [Adineta ricciae]
MHFYLKFFLIGIVCYAREPADKGANEKTRYILNFLDTLPAQNRYLSGQFAGWSNVTFNLIQMDQITNRTGHTPAILGCDYAAGWLQATPPQTIINYSCNKYLKDHSDANGLVTIDIHFPNPASPDGGFLKNRTNLTFTDLLDFQSETGQRWKSYLNIIADGLNELQEANVTVLFRPLHEMNGAWFWWGQQNPNDFRSVWISMFEYFCTEMNLHNLLWIYAPDQSAPNPSMFYPGDDYVDIVALDAYVDDPNSMQGYEEMVRLGKPFALGEVGPHTTDGKFDYSLWPIAIANRFNLISYFFAWDGIYSPIENRNAYQLFNNKHVINRDQL